MSPLCESFLSAEQVNSGEVFYPLHAYLCEKCYLVQLQQYVSVASIFEEYAYFSPYSDSWLAHAKKYTEDMISRFGLGEKSHVVEVASNDGYLLQNFVKRVCRRWASSRRRMFRRLRRKRACRRWSFFRRQPGAELAAKESAPT